MSKYAVRLAVLLFATLIATPTSSAPMFTPFVSFTEEPVRLLRNTDFHLAPLGAQLQSGDTIESGRAGLQLECGVGCTAALGPDSKIAIRFDAKGANLLLLGGWLKVQSLAAPTNGVVVVRSADMQVKASNFSLVLHSAPGRSELFVESGNALIEELEGTRPVRQTTFRPEQYGRRVGGRPLEVLPQPPKEFINSVPAVFLYRLLPVPFQMARSFTRGDRPTVPVVDTPRARETVDRRSPPPRRQTGSTPSSTSGLSKARLNELRTQELARMRAIFEASTAKPAASPKPASTPATDPAPPAVETQ